MERMVLRPAIKADCYLRFLKEGIGIFNDQLDSIFDRFTQADLSTTRNYGGEGLGLAISRQLAELMGGGIWMESEVGRGSTFLFASQFGIQIASNASLTNTLSGIATPSKAKLVVSVAGRPLNVLLADGSADNRLLVSAFSKEGLHRLDLVENGQEAVAKFKTRSYDLVLMDMQMPVMDAYEASSLIRKWEKEQQKLGTPIIAFAANALKEDVERSLAAGCTDRLSNPISEEVIPKALTAI